MNKETVALLENSGFNFSSKFIDAEYNKILKTVVLKKILVQLIKIVIVILVKILLGHIYGTCLWLMKYWGYLWPLFIMNDLLFEQ